MDPLDYGVAFQDNQVLTYERTLHHVLEYRQVGYLHLPSGNLVARDPHEIYEGLIFDAAFPPGNYPVFVTHAFCDVSRDVAFAGIRFTDSHPIRWEPTEGRDEEGRAPGYGVDSATGSFMDDLTDKLLDQRLEEERELYPYPEVSPIDQYMYDNLVNKSWAEIYLDPERQANLFTFKLSGDGHYVSYYGYDANGAIACIITDFFGLGCKEIVSWPASYPPVPKAFNPDFFTWLHRITPLMEYPNGWDERNPLSSYDIQFLEVQWGTPLPEQFLLYYAYGTPWLLGAEPLQKWWPQLHARMQALLQTDRPMLPIGPETVAVFETDETFIIHECYSSENNATSTFEYPCTLKTFLLLKAMQDLGSLEVEGK